MSQTRLWQLHHRNGGIASSPQRLSGPLSLVSGSWEALISFNDFPLVFSEMRWRWRHRVVWELERMLLFVDCER